MNQVCTQEVPFVPRITEASAVGPRDWTTMKKTRRSVGKQNKNQIGDTDDRTKRERKWRGKLFVCSAPRSQSFERFIAET